MTDLLPLLKEARQWFGPVPIIDAALFEFVGRLDAAIAEHEAEPEWEPRVGTPERQQWQRQKNMLALQQVDSLRLARAQPQEEPVAVVRAGRQVVWVQKVPEEGTRLYMEPPTRICLRQLPDSPCPPAQAVPEGWVRISVNEQVEFVAGRIKPLGLCWQPVYSPPPPIQKLSKDEWFKLVEDEFYRLAAAPKPGGEDDN